MEFSFFYDWCIQDVKMSMELRAVVCVCPLAADICKTVDSCIVLGMKNLHLQQSNTYCHFNPTSQYIQENKDV
jgi:hypothetical protein